MYKNHFKLSLPKTIRNISTILVFFIFSNIFYYGNIARTTKHLENNLQEQTKIEIIALK